VAAGEPDRRSRQDDMRDGGQHGYRDAVRVAVSCRGGDDRSGIVDFSEASAGD